VALAYLVGALSPARQGVASGSSPAPAHDAGDPRDARPNILLVTIDTLRADHVSAYGYARDTMPALTALAARGTRFDRAYANASWTIPSIASVLTGVLPSEHGVEHATLEDASMRQEMISEELPSLAASLRAAGYRTCAVVGSGHLDASLGYARGFDDYTGLGFVEQDGVWAEVERRIPELEAGDAPYFLWVHLIDAHAPYTPREPRMTAWWPAGEERPTGLDRAQNGVQVPVLAIAQRVPMDVAIAYATTAWDTEIAQVDDALARMLARLDDGHLAVVVTADHGEEFLEHGAMGHGNTLFEEVVHVPLVIAVPGQAPSTTRSLVSLVDLLPTLVELGGGALPERHAGRSLLPLLRGEAFPATRDVIMETGGPLVVRGIFDGRYKYGEVVAAESIPGTEGVEGLFDLEADPAEHTSILEGHADVAGPLRERLLAVLAEARAHRPAVHEGTRPLTAARRAQLEALGYGR
jgi:arylsulfatase A-like enzyme